MRPISIVRLALVSSWASSMSWVETMTCKCNYSSYADEEGLHAEITYKALTGRFIKSEFYVSL